MQLFNGAYCSKFTNAKKEAGQKSGANPSIPKVRAEEFETLLFERIDEIEEMMERQTQTLQTSLEKGHPACQKYAVVTSVMIDSRQALLESQANGDSPHQVRRSDIVP